MCANAFYVIKYIIYSLQLLLLSSSIGPRTRTRAGARAGPFTVLNNRLHRVFTKSPQYALFH